MLSFQGRMSQPSRQMEPPRQRFGKNLRLESEAEGDPLKHLIDSVAHVLAACDTTTIKK